MKFFLFAFGVFLTALSCRAECPQDSVEVRNQDGFSTINMLITQGCSFHFYLSRDIVFTQEDFTPLGKKENECTPFSGSMDGNGYTIRGLKVNEEQTSAGLFCAIGNATVENIVFDESCSFKGENTGSLASFVRDELVLKNVTSRASLSGTKATGGFVATVEQAKPIKLTFLDCVNEGTIDNAASIGGFVGSIINTESSTVKISNCVSNVTINSKLYPGTNVGGFIGSLRSNTNIHCNINNSTNIGNVKTSYVGQSNGGFIGDLDSNTFLTLIVDSCLNNNTVVTKAQYIGGFVGYAWTNKNSTITISRSINSGKVESSHSNHGCVGGFIGKFYGNNHTLCKLTHNVNSGNISATQTCSYIGGFIAVFDNSHNPTLIVDTCTNNGFFYISTQSYDACVGGIVGILQDNDMLILHILQSENNGFITVDSKDSNSYVGGLIGLILSSKGTFLSISDNKNNGIIIAKSQWLCSVGGFIGKIFEEETLQLRMDNNIASNCTTGESLEQSSFAGGFIGSIHNSSLFTAVLYKNTFQGNVSGTVTREYCDVGGLIGDIMGCSNMSLTLNEWQSSSCSAATLNTNNTTGSYSYCGGIIGHIASCDNSTVDVSRVENNCQLVAKSGRNSLVGGIIGEFYSNNEMNLTMDSMTNNGIIDVSGMSVRTHCSGIIGQFSNSRGNTLIITNTMNTGNLFFNGNIYVNIGGLIGYSGTLTSTMASFENCSNQGTIQTNSSTSNVGGFIGQIAGMEDVTFSFIRVSNNGLINGTNYSGGFIGFMENCSHVVMNMTCASNNGDIYTNISEDSSAGFIGMISSAISTNVYLNNSANRGDISSQSVSCGFVCHSLEEGSTLIFRNCVNKGNINGTFSYGIATAVSNAINIVSLGNVSGANPFFFLGKRETTFNTLCVDGHKRRQFNNQLP